MRWTTHRNLGHKLAVPERPQKCQRILRPVEVTHPDIEINCTSPASSAHYAASRQVAPPSVHPLSVLGPLKTASLSSPDHPPPAPSWPASPPVAALPETWSTPTRSLDSGCTSVVEGADSLPSPRMRPVPAHMPWAMPARRGHPRAAEGCRKLRSQPPFTRVSTQVGIGTLLTWQSTCQPRSLRLEPRYPWVQPDWRAVHVRLRDSRASPACFDSCSTSIPYCSPLNMR